MSPSDSPESGRTAGIFPQVYRTIRRNALIHSTLHESCRFTCEAEWRADPSERALWGTSAGRIFPQVYRTIRRNTLIHSQLHESCRFTCGEVKKTDPGERAFSGRLPTASGG